MIVVRQQRFCVGDPMRVSQTEPCERVQQSLLVRQVASVERLGMQHAVPVPDCVSQASVLQQGAFVPQAVVGVEEHAGTHRRPLHISPSQHCTEGLAGPHPPRSGMQHLWLGRVRVPQVIAPQQFPVVPGAPIHAAVELPMQEVQRLDPSMRPEQHCEGALVAAPSWRQHRLPEHVTPVVGQHSPTLSHACVSGLQHRPDS